MTATIDHININDIFWIHIKDHLVTFGFKGLPEDTHFTISFDDKSPDINLHVTKNVSDPKNKPKITVVRINKTLLEKVAPSLTLSILNKLLQPIDIDELKNRYNHDLGYITFDNFGHSDSFSLTEQKLIDSFKDISRFKKKTRLKIEGNIEKRLESIANSKDLQTSIFKNMVELSTEFQKPFEVGIIISEENILQVIRINNKWFTLKTDLKPSDLLTAFVNPRLCKHLIWKTKRALVAVKNAETYSETKHLNKPVRLVLINT